jgi:glycosyltransferase involved in cell wall biosynthesis
MTMKRILLVAPFTLLPDEIGDNRFRYIAELLATKHHVTFVTSNFNHPEKKFRQQNQAFSQQPYRLVLLKELGYKKNIGLARIRSHWRFTKNLKTYLAQCHGAFDYVYSAIPTIGAAKACAAFSRSQNIPFILDVQDVWPEGIFFYFKKLKWLAKLMLSPLSKQADTVYAQADVLFGITQTHLNRAVRANKKAQLKQVVYLGTDLAVFDRYSTLKPMYKKKPNEFLGIYIGTISHSYDVSTFIIAAAALKKEGMPVRILVLGDGQNRHKMEKLASQLNAPVDFLGVKPYEEMCGYLKLGDFALHSIVLGSQSSLTTKFCDYCAAGLPVLNSSQNPEIKQIILIHGLGINYQPGNVAEIVLAIQTLALNPNKRAAMGRASRFFAEQMLDRKKIYSALFPLFE